MRQSQKGTMVWCEGAGRGLCSQFAGHCGLRAGCGIGRCVPAALSRCCFRILAPVGETCWRDSTRSDEQFRIIGSYGKEFSQNLHRLGWESGLVSKSPCGSGGPRKEPGGRYRTSGAGAAKTAAPDRGQSCGADGAVRRDAVENRKWRDFSIAQYASGIGRCPSGAIDAAVFRL